MKTIDIAAVHRRLSFRLKAIAATLLATLQLAPELLTQAWAALPADMRTLIPHADKIAVFLLIASLLASYAERKPNG